MNLKNLNNCCELRSENPIEAQALLVACRRSYSPRMCGLMPNNDQMVVLTKEETEEFCSGVLRDIGKCPAPSWIKTHTPTL